MQLHLTPKKFKTDNYFVSVTGYLSGGAYKNLYFSKSNSENGYTLDNISLAFHKKFKERYDIEECEGKVVNVIGKVYVNPKGLGGLKNIVSVQKTRPVKPSQGIDTSTCFFDDLLFDVSL